jgi:hypothetical protein
VRSREDRTRIRVLRLCSVFEPPPSALVGKGVRFDPIGGMQNHTAELTWALDRRDVVQTVLTTRPPPLARVSSRPLSVPGKEAGQGLRNLLWGVLLDEVPALLDELELRARDLLAQSRS